MELPVTRIFKVTGVINCNYDPNGTGGTTVQVANIKVELWQKQPAQVILLGTGFTDQDGKYEIEFSALSPTIIIEDGKINEVFVKAYYAGEIIIGANPY